jgi:hypothetical protein
VAWFSLVILLDPPRLLNDGQAVDLLPDRSETQIDKIGVNLALCPLCSVLGLLIVVVSVEFIHVSLG